MASSIVEEKFKLLDNFKDERLIDFGKKIIYQEALKFYLKAF